MTTYYGVFYDNGSDDENPLTAVFEQKYAAEEYAEEQMTHWWNNPPEMLVAEIAAEDIAPALAITRDLSEKQERELGWTDPVD